MARHPFLERNIEAEKEIAIRQGILSFATIALLVSMTIVNRSPMDGGSWATKLLAISISLITGLRFLLLYSLRRQNSAHSRKRLFIAEACAIISGLLWGVFVWISLDSDSDLNFYDIVTLLGTVMQVIGMCTTLTPKPKLAKLYAITVLIVPIAGLAFSPIPHFRGLAALLLVFLIFVFAQITIQHRQFRKILRHKGYRNLQKEVGHEEAHIRELIVELASTQSHGRQLQLAAQIRQSLEKIEAEKELAHRQRSS